MISTVSRLCLMVAVLITLAAGCAPQHPMSVSEFKGFCYQAPNGRDKFCDNIGICDEYMAVIEAEQPSQGVCTTACQEVLDAYVRNNPPDGCDRVSYDGLMWCQRFCRENYPNPVDAPALAGKPAQVETSAPAQTPAQPDKPAS